MLPGRQHQASPLFQPHEPCLWQPLDIFGQLILEPQPRSVLVSLTRHGPCCALLFWLQPRSVRRKSSLALAPLIRGWVNFRGLTGEMWGGLGPAKLIQIKQVLSDSLHVSRDTLYKVEHNMGAKTWTLRSEVLKAKTRWEGPLGCTPAAFCTPQPCRHIHQIPRAVLTKPPKSSESLPCTCPGHISSAEG